MKAMKIAIVQYDIAWNNVEENIRRVERLINNVEADLFVLPEMWATGFDVHPTPELAAASRQAEMWMKQTAAERNAAVCGTLITDVEGVYRNRAFFYTPSGLQSVYDKRHLFSPGGENKAYAAGEQRVVTEYKGVRILLQICYDLRFPVFSRNRADYDLMINMANWPASRQSVWDVLSRARAIENQCYVAAVNRVGDDTSCHYTGGSALIDARGQVLDEIKNQSGIIVAQLDFEQQNTFRKRFPVLNDADDFKLA